MFDARRVTKSVAIAGVLLVAPLARATPSDSATAERLFAEGRAAMKRQDYTLACVRFAESQRLDPAPGTLLNLAECNQKLGKVVTAWRFLRQASASLPAGDDRVGEASRLAAELKPKVPLLTVRLVASAPAEARVVLDGADLPRSELDVAVPVEPGRHRLEVVFPDGRRQEHTQSLVEGESRVVTVGGADGSPATAVGDMRPAGTTQRTLGFVVGGAGVVGFGIGVAFLVGSSGKEGDMNSYRCSSIPCTGSDQVAIDRLYEEARSAHTAGILALTLGGAAVAGGIVLVLTAPSNRSKAQGLRISPSPVLAGAAMTMGGVW